MNTHMTLRGSIDPLPGFQPANPSTMAATIAVNVNVCPSCGARLWFAEGQCLCLACGYDGADCST